MEAGRQGRGIREREVEGMKETRYTQLCSLCLMGQVGAVRGAQSHRQIGELAGKAGMNGKKTVDNADAVRCGIAGR